MANFKIVSTYMPGVATKIDGAAMMYVCVQDNNVYAHTGDQRYRCYKGIVSYKTPDGEMFDVNTPERRELEEWVVASGSKMSLAEAHAQFSTITEENYIK